MANLNVLFGKEKTMHRILPLSFNRSIHYPRRFMMITLMLMSAIAWLWLIRSVYAAPQAGSVSGNVFRDYNANGIDDGLNEPGIGGVVITATDNIGTVVTTTTSADGSYTTSILPGASARVEFALPGDGSLDFLQPGAAGNTTVQFVDISAGSATNVDVGFNNPAQYCEANPYMAVPSYFWGTSSTLDGIARFSYNDSGITPAPTTLTDWTSIGTTYGVAYNPAQDALYASAYVKRHSALAGSAGAIYRVAGVTGGTFTTTLFATIPDIGTVPDNTTRGLPANPIDASFDPAVFGLVGQAGLGDMDISDDGSTLYVVNLNNRSVYPVATATGTVGTPIAIPSPTCTNGEWRPFATQFHDGDLYVGGVCSAENVGGTPADLTAQVYRYDVSTATWSSGLFSPVISLDFVRGRGFNSGTVPDDGHWNPWINDGPTLFNRTTALVSGVADIGVLYPQPMLADIEFDSQGYMLLGFRDRTGDQVGYLNRAVDASDYPGPGTGVDPYWYSSPAGDILIAAPNGATFALENNGVVGGRTTGATSLQGPGGREFFHGDIFTNTVGFPVHQETSFGALAVRPGSAEVAMTAYDATDVDEGAVYWMNLANGGGDKLRGYRIYFGNQDSFPPAPENGRFGKANGLGDLELLCAPAPIEIGNRVWGEQTNNGIQDPSVALTEAPIPGVVISLYEIDGTLVATDTTDANGQYIFNNTTVPGGVQPNTQYVVRINNVTPILSAGYSYITLANVGSNDRIDNDAVSGNAAGVPGPNRPEIALTTGPTGHNNHTYDFGFTAAPTAVTIQGMGIRSVTENAAAFLIIVPLALVFTGLFLWRRRFSR